MPTTEAEAREFLEPYNALLYEAVAGGLQDYQREFGERRASLTSRSDASNRNDLIWARLRTSFDSMSQVTFSEYRNRRLMVIEERFAFRVKKLNKDLRPMNYVTQLVLEFLEHRTQHLPGLEPPTNVDLSYIFDDLAETHARVFIRCPKGLKGHRWMLELEQPASVMPSSSESFEVTTPRRVKVRAPKPESIEETRGGLSST